MGLFLFSAGRFAANPILPTRTPFGLPTTVPRTTDQPGPAFVPADSSLHKTQTAQAQPVQPTALPTLLPTPTAIEMQPGPAGPANPVGPNPYPPTGGAPAASDGSNQPPPSDRNNPPPGSRRLGEFAVEGYCNTRGYGVQVVNNQNDWACTDKNNGNVLFVLQPTDFDAICRQWYNNPRAFAIRDMRKDIQAYNWSCYEYVSNGIG
jgi:hypothetical protein